MSTQIPYVLRTFESQNRDDPLLPAEAARVTESMDVHCPRAVPGC